MGSPIAWQSEWALGVVLVSHDRKDVYMHLDDLASLTTTRSGMIPAVSVLTRLQLFSEPERWEDFAGSCSPRLQFVGAQYVSRFLPIVNHPLFGGPGHTSNGFRAQLHSSRAYHLYWHKGR